MLLVHMFLLVYESGQVCWRSYYLKERRKENEGDVKQLSPKEFCMFLFSTSTARIDVFCNRRYVIYFYFAQLQ
jgi:hypothetical protein